MKKIHSVQRAEERYYIDDFHPGFALEKIREDKCMLVESNPDRFSNIFMMLYNNKYIKVVTDLNITYVKTVLPLKSNDFEFINVLIEKLNGSKMLAA